MKTVHKYPLTITDLQEINTYEGWQPLLVEVQAGPCLWALVDTGRAMLVDQISITGTGRPVPDDAEHCGSFQMPPFVWHVWRRRR
jgi:hypothetical protein